MSVLLDEVFAVTGSDALGYTRVSRINGTSSSADLTLTLDINNELYPLKAGDSITLQLSSSLSIDGKDSYEGSSWREPRAGTKLSLK